MATPRLITAAEVEAGEQGDVQGPDTAEDGNIALFDGTTGKLLKAAGVVEGVATIDSTNNILIGDGAGNAVDSGKAIDALSPITLNPDDVLCQDENETPILKVNGDSQLVLPTTVTMETPGVDFVIPNDSDLTMTFGENGGGSINANGVSGELYLSSDSGDPNGKLVRISTGQSNSGTDGNGGDIFLSPENGTGSGRKGIVIIQNVLQLDPTDTPDSPEEGWIYANVSDHHLYYYNGTTWKQLDNA